MWSMRPVWLRELGPGAPTSWKRPQGSLLQPAGKGPGVHHPAPPQASWLWGHSLCACRSQRQLSAHRGPFVLAASSARRAAGNGARSPHPLPRPPAVGHCHSRLARRPLAPGASAGSCLPGRMSGRRARPECTLPVRAGGLATLAAHRGHLRPQGLPGLRVGRGGVLCPDRKSRGAQASRLSPSERHILRRQQAELPVPGCPE